MTKKLYKLQYASTALTVTVTEILSILYIIWTVATGVLDIDGLILLGFTFHLGASIYFLYWKKVSLKPTFILDLLLCITNLRIMSWTFKPLLPVITLFFLVASATFITVIYTTFKSYLAAKSTKYTSLPTEPQLPPNFPKKRVKAVFILSLAVIGLSALSLVTLLLTAGPSLQSSELTEFQTYVTRDPLFGFLLFLLMLAFPYEIYKRGKTPDSAVTSLWDMTAFAIIILRSLYSEIHPLFNEHILKSVIFLFLVASLIRMSFINYTAPSQESKEKEGTSNEQPA